MSEKRAIVAAGGISSDSASGGDIEMMSSSDEDLVRDYAQHKTPRAFALLVERHLDLVYAVARRQVRSSALAEEVAQLVFIDLAHQAADLPSDTPLVAWLHLVSRRTAIDVVRRETRRTAREHAAAEILAMDTPPPDWQKIEPLLDEAVASLATPARTAILLRFFEGRSLREVGAALGISDDTAQKRVRSALDDLHAFFMRRGVTTSAAAFATALSTHAAVAAPAGLGASISAALATQAAAPAAVAAAQHLAMTATQKTFATVAIAAALGFALYEAIPASRLHREVRAGEQRLDALASESRALAVEQNAASRQLAALGRSDATPEPGTDAALAEQAAAWVARIAQLKRVLVERPELNIPELQFLAERDWLLAAINENMSPAQIDSSLLLLRTRAKQRFLEHVSQGVKAHFAAARMLPAQPAQLAALLVPPVDPALLARYDFRSEHGRLTLAEKLAGAPDPDRLALGAWLDTRGRQGLLPFNGWENAESRAVREADDAYARANNGTRATDSAQLAPFLASPIEPATLDQLFRKIPLSRRPPASAVPAR